jgi:hypothetical protein
LFVYLSHFIFLFLSFSRPLAHLEAIAKERALCAQTNALGSTGAPSSPPPSLPSGRHLGSIPPLLHKHSQLFPRVFIIVFASSTRTEYVDTCLCWHAL